MCWLVLSALTAIVRACWGIALSSSYHSLLAALSTPPAMLGPSRTSLALTLCAAFASYVAAAPVSTPRGSLSGATLALVKANLAANDADS